MDQSSPAPGRRRFPQLPLYARALIGVALGLAFGIIFEPRPSWRDYKGPPVRIQAVSSTRVAEIANDLKK